MGILDVGGSRVADLSLLRRETQKRSSECNGCGIFEDGVALHSLSI